MPLTVSPFLESDIHDFAVADAAAVIAHDWNFARAMEVPGVPRVEFVEKWTRDGWGKDPLAKWMKVSDSETGEFVSVALWKFPPPQGEKVESSYGKEPPPAMVPAIDPETVEQGKKVDLKSRTSNDAFFAQLGKEWEVFKRDFIGNQPYIHLQILMTDPKHERCGAGSMLVKWGCDMADEQGLLIALTASAIGHGLYTKHGFEMKDVGTIDLKPYGIDSTEKRRRMIRLPRKTSREG